jgi:hypothetical protein
VAESADNLSIWPPCGQLVSMTLLPSEPCVQNLEKTAPWEQHTEVTVGMILDGHLEPDSAKLEVCSVNQAQDYSCA